MKVYIDTSNKHLFLALVKDQKILNHILIENLLKKADALPEAFLSLINEHKTKDINDFFVTIGPGSFTGTRTGLVFARSICQITKANLHTTSSIQLMAGPKGSKEIFIDARSDKSYYGLVKDGQLSSNIKLVEFKESTEQKYDEFLLNPTSYDSIYKKEDNILSVHPLYIKDAKIGGV